LDIHFRGSPFYVALPYANLFWTGILSVIIGVVIAFFGNFSFAQELMPGKVGMISGLFWFRFWHGRLGLLF
jgi:FSR family fosmidomycin resistance protein-like MFS transporter